MGFLKNASQRRGVHLGAEDTIIPTSRLAAIRARVMSGARCLARVACVEDEQARWASLSLNLSGTETWLSDMLAGHMYVCALTH